nr:hypothetical protein [Bifidobacterium dentium]
MSVQFRPITGREDGDWFDEEEPFRIPPSYMLVDNGLVWAWSPNGCYRCSFRYLESAMVFTFLDRWGYRHDRIVAWNVLDDMGFLSRAFKIQIGRELSVRTNYSKLMGESYLAVNCSHCGAIQGVNFIINDYLGRGGVFSNPRYDSVPIQVKRLPLLTRDKPGTYRWAFEDPFTRDVPARRLVADQPFRFHPAPTSRNPSPWNPQARP